MYLTRHDFNQMNISQLYIRTFTLKIYTLCKNPGDIFNNIYQKEINFREFDKVLQKHCIWSQNRHHIPF